MADIFPQQAAASQQPPTSQASSLGLNQHWSTGSVTAGAPSFLQRASHSLEVHPGQLVCSAKPDCENAVISLTSVHRDLQKATKKGVHFKSWLYPLTGLPRMLPPT